MGDGGPSADAEVIALADRSLSAAASVDATVRIGHVGLILEVLAHTGLPAAARSALVEMLSDAAAEGEGIQALDSVLERLTGWLRSGGEADLIVPAVSQADDGASTVCSASSFPTSPAAAPATRSSTASAASGT